MAATTSSTLDDLFVNIVAQARYTAEEQSLLRNLVTVYNIDAQAGKTVQVPKYPAITAAALTEGTDMSSTAVSTSSVAITVSEVGAQVLLTDLAAMGAGNPAEAADRQAARHIVSGKPCRHNTVGPSPIA